MSKHCLWIAATLVTTALAGCTAYDAPPESTLVLPEGGSFAAGQPVRINFSEPIDPDTLRVNVWPDIRDIENEIPSGAEPIIDNCGGDCGELLVEVSDDRRHAMVTFDAESLGKPGVPLLLEVLPGLADDLGNDTGAAEMFAIKFRPSDDRFNEEPVEFQDGIYILVGQVKDPLPATLTLVSDVQVDEAGEFRLAGAEGDEIQGAPKNTRRADEVTVDTTSQGWTAYATGFVKLEDGKRFLRSDPFNVELPLAGLVIKLDNVRLDAEITRPEETGNDRIEGTLSFEKLTLVNSVGGETEYEGGNTALIADWSAPEVAPEGYPEVCGNLCGAVTGLCEPPGDFPGEDFCTNP
jgi:hypothetical protein